MLPEVAKRGHIVARNRMFPSESRNIFFFAVIMFSRVAKRGNIVEICASSIYCLVLARALLS